MIAKYSEESTIRVIEALELCTLEFHPVSIQELAELAEMSYSLAYAIVTRELSDYVAWQVCPPSSAGGTIGNKPALWGISLPFAEDTNSLEMIAASRIVANRGARVAGERIQNGETLL